MTISARIALGISATTLSLSLALATAALAQDPMRQDLEFRNSLSRYDGAKKETISMDPVKKEDGAGFRAAASMSAPIGPTRRKLSRPKHDELRRGLRLVPQLSVGNEAKEHLMNHSSYRADRLTHLSDNSRPRPAQVATNSAVYQDGSHTS